MKQHRVYDQLRHAIYTGRIKPGEKLVERRLAAEFETGRGPLRESLLRLIGEGLVHRSPRRASYVQELTVCNIRDIYVLRLAIEPTAARQAATHPQRIFIKQLKLLVDRMAQEMEQGHQLASAEADFEFHRMIVEASRSQRLIRAYHLAHVPMLISQRSPEWGKPEALRDIHLEIVNLIESGASDEAEAAVRRHVERASRRYSEA